MLKRLLLVAIAAPVLYHAWSGANTPDLDASAADVPRFEFDASLSPSDDPVQEAARGVAPFRVEDYVLTPLASFQIAGRVLGAKHYRSDREADLAPVDLAMGWGPMADPAVLADIDISQSGRFYRWRVESFPIPAQEITRHSANMHLVPANGDVADKLHDITEGQLVRFKGYLLQIETDDGWHWKSSMTRNDQGAGACEVVLVDTIDVI